MIKAGWKAAARRSFPLRIGPEGDACDNDDDSKTKPMASRPIAHLLIACGIFAATTRKQEDFHEKASLNRERGFGLDLLQIGASVQERERERTLSS